MIYRLLLTCLGISFFVSTTQAQCPAKSEILKQVDATENNVSLSNSQKLDAFNDLEKIAARCIKDKDSVHAWIFLKMGKYEYLTSNNYENTLKCTRAALQINNTTQEGASGYLNINAYFNMATAYEALLSYHQALKYYDSSILLASRFVDTNTFVLDARVAKANIYFTLGDYQKAAEESIQGARLAETENNVLTRTSFLNMQAQAFCFQNNVQASLPVTLEAITSAKEIDNNFQLASAYKTLALNYSRKKFYDSAKLYFTKAIQYRLTTNAYSNIGADYNEFGNFYNKMKDYDNAAKCYALFLEYAQKITDPVDKSIKTAMAFLNTGDIFFKQKQFKKTEASYLKAMNILHFNVSGILQDMPVKSLAMLNSHAELIITLMDNMTELLLQEYKLNHQALYLNACMQTALTTDSIITQIRHEHIAEQTKIYWREKTSRFYANAIEAAYLDKNTNRAFYFLEKSRAVLLGEKLNELNAASFLPATEKKQEEAYQYKIIELEQKLASLDAGSKQFGDTRFQLLNAKDNFENYIKSLEQRYPVYYQNKYADDVPTLQEVQSFLSRTHQSLVHYFFNDTINYALVISPGAVNFTRLYSGRPVQEMLVAFNGLCADKIRQNNNYNEFIQQSNFIYQTVFQPLHIPHGRLIICTDNIVIPFEALCTDKTGRDFLISQYSFDYVYSARFLMQPFKSGSAKGDFIGFAPVTFSQSLHLPSLSYAGTALKSCSAYYTTTSLFTHEAASRENFFKNASSYAIVNIFSHARADTTGREPVLFMQDSDIHLSELQLLQKPATQLVLLSACETNVGKAATGEGVYSLARGFAAAGIPAVAATLWKADEKTIYAISEKFNQYLSEGMNKDEALQKAKLDFIQNNQGTEKLLPYYWANMILIGNTDAVNLSSSHHYAVWVTAAILLMAIAWIVLYRRKKKKL